MAITQIFESSAVVVKKIRNKKKRTEQDHVRKPLIIILFHLEIKKNSGTFI